MPVKKKQVSITIIWPSLNGLQIKVFKNDYCDDYNDFYIYLKIPKIRIWLN